jgi:hypothetical protein
VIFVPRQVFGGARFFFLGGPKWGVFDAKIFFSGQKVEKIESQNVNKLSHWPQTGFISAKNHSVTTAEIKIATNTPDSTFAFLPKMGCFLACFRGFGGGLRGIRVPKGRKTKLAILLAAKIVKYGSIRDTKRTKLTFFEQNRGGKA